jgi:5,10-methylenetetrahydromethanopterin reductase
VTGELLSVAQLAMPAAGWNEKLAEFGAAGATDVAYQPAGPDIARELEAFAEAARGLSVAMRRPTAAEGAA